VPSHRIQQINKLILELLNAQMLREIDLPAGSFVTITKVDTTRDLGLARVTMSVMPADKQAPIHVYMNRQAGHFQRVLGRNMKLYKVPKLTFTLDTSGSHVEHLDQLIDKIHNEQ
jgi:ribosome-binding factor A